MPQKMSWCSLCDHAMVAYEVLARGEIATRMIVHNDVVGLSDEQVDQVLQVVRTWRTRYHALVGQANAQGEDVQRELAQYEPDRTAINAALADRVDLFAKLESEFVRAWLELWDIVSYEQYDRLVSIYSDELDWLPDWVKQGRATLRREPAVSV